MKKNYYIFATVLALLVLAVFIFGNFPPGDLQGRVNDTSSKKEKLVEQEMTTKKTSDKKSKKDMPQGEYEEFSEQSNDEYEIYEDGEGVELCSECIAGCEFEFGEICLLTPEECSYGEFQCSEDCYADGCRER